MGGKKSLDLVNEIHVGKEMCTTALIEIEGIEQTFFNCNWNLAAIEIDSFRCTFTFDTLEFALISAPLICNDFATFKTTNRDNHSLLTVMFATWL